MKRGKGRYITKDEALQVLGEADQRGLVHMAVHDPEQQIYATCSCCSCCCHEFRYLQTYGRRDLVARSDYAAQTSPDACTGCNECLDRCPFHARFKKGGVIVEDPDACYGCGLCVTICPSNAITMRRRDKTER